MNRRDFVRRLAVGAAVVTVAPRLLLDRLVAAAPYSEPLLPGFLVGERIAFIRSGHLVTNAIGVVTAIEPEIGCITVDFSGMRPLADNDYTIGANV